MAVLTATKVTQPKEIFSTLFHPINYYPADKRLQNKPRSTVIYPVESIIHLLNNSWQIGMINSCCVFFVIMSGEQQVQINNRCSEKEPTLQLSLGRNKPGFDRRSKALMNIHSHLLFVNWKLCSPLNGTHDTYVYWQTEGLVSYNR